MRKLLPLLVGVALLTGCAKHYKITDTTSGDAYYTKKYDESRRTGQVTFKDAKSGDKLTLDSARISKISKSEFKEETQD